MNKVINLVIPYVGEQVFESLENDSLTQCLEVSEASWKVLAENVLLKRWKGKMLLACRTGKTQIVKLLLQHYNSEESGLKSKDENGWTPFMMACCKGHTDVVEFLLDHSEGNIDLNAKSMDGWTAFILACQHGHKDVVKVLLDHSNGNINLNTRTTYGWTAFMLACSEGHKHVVKLLLDHAGRPVTSDHLEIEGSLSLEIDDGLLEFIHCSRVLFTH